MKPEPSNTDLEDSAIDLGRRGSGGLIWSPASMCEKDIVHKSSLKRHHVSDECQSENSEEDYMLDDSRAQLMKRIRLDEVNGQKQKPRVRISSDSAIVSPNYGGANNRNCGSENSRDSVLYKFKSEIINRINRNSRSADEDEDVDDQHQQQQQQQKESVRRAFAAAAAACVVSSQVTAAAGGNGIVPKFHGFDRVNFKKMLMENFTEMDKCRDVKSEETNCSSESSSSPRHHIIANSPKDYLYFPSAARFNKGLSHIETDGELAGPDSTANQHSPSSLIDFHHRFAYNENSGNEHNIPNHHHHSSTGEEKKRERNFQVSAQSHCQWQRII